MMATEPNVHPKTTSPPPPQPQTSLSPSNHFNNPASVDINLTLTSKDGVTVSVNVHRQILASHSRFFAVKLSDHWAKQQCSPLPYIVEMYSNDLTKKLMRDLKGT